jgi:hypothetical protein
MTEPAYRRHQARASRDTASVASISRLAYQHEHYRRPVDAIAGMRAQLVDGWRIVQIHGPAEGPLEIDYLRQVESER